MKIRSITYFINPGWPLNEDRLVNVGKFASKARTAFEADGFEVQTVRMATPPFPTIVPELNFENLSHLTQELEKRGLEMGYEYISLGPALPDLPNSYPLVSELIAASENIFFAGMMTHPVNGVSLPAVRACAEIIHKSAPLSPDGFANLRFAALANVPAGAPFFPAAYHEGAAPSFALAMEAADLAVDAFKEHKTLKDAREALVARIESAARTLQKISQGLCEELAIPFGGIDFTLAPFPEEALSFGTAVELAGAPGVGRHGSLAAAAILADTLDRAQYPRAGFNGLMLPILEDAVLAQRAAEGLLTVKDLLLYSTVCGTGLDTVPLPGDTTVEQIYAVLLDLAALSLRLDKPLTARLMPIPGKVAGDETGFDFAFFANSRVLALEAAPIQRALSGSENLKLRAR